MHALVDGESLCKELATAAEDEEAANAGLNKVRYCLDEVLHWFGYVLCFLDKVLIVICCLNKVLYYCVV